MPTVRDILNQKGHAVVTVRGDETVLSAARLMNEQHIGALVVTSGEQVLGVFTERDILNRVVAGLRDPASTLVREVMTAPVACCSPETSRAECRAVMRQRRIRHLPVVGDGKLLGIVSIGDILIDEGVDQQQTIHYLTEYMMGHWPGPSEASA